MRRDQICLGLGLGLHLDPPNGVNVPSVMPETVVTVDGKALRGARDKRETARTRTMLSAHAPVLAAGTL